MDRPSFAPPIARPIHDRDRFYKYRTANRLIEMIRTRRLVFAAPRTFNDPFDLSLDLRLDFELEDITELLLSRLRAMVFDDAEPRGDLSNPIFKTLTGLRPHRDMLRGVFDDSEPIRKVLREGEARIRATNEQWKTWQSGLRILCLVEDPANLLMWAHYAEGHAGGVVKLACDPKLESPLWSAFQVRYFEELPVVTGAEALVRRILGTANGATEDDFYDHVITKGIDWSYEREWRCLAWPKAGAEGDALRFSELHPHEISAVYFGMKMSSENESELLELLRGDLSHVEVFRAERSRARFGLEFRQIR